MLRLYSFNDLRELLTKLWHAPACLEHGEQAKGICVECGEVRCTECYGYCYCSMQERGGRHIPLYYILFSPFLLGGVPLG